MSSLKQKVYLYSALAMVAFAANSLIGRAGLVETSTDPASFAVIRLVSGAGALLALLKVSTKARVGGDMRGGLLLLSYALPFSFAYVSLATGTGALILFGCVQTTMMGVGVAKGERPPLLRWVGGALAAWGLFALVLPGVEAPSLLGAGLMALSGVAWGLYSLHGKATNDPLAATAGNFIRAAFACVALGPLLFLASYEFSLDVVGVALAVTSGAVTSGFGYAIWYAVLPDLSASTAAIIQLTVPVVAAVLGVLFLTEVPSLRLVLNSALVLGGVALAMVPRKSTHQDG
jgi:drug/metabolite transporter (DMT)-like permease